MFIVNGITLMLMTRHGIKNIEERNCRVLNGEGGSDYYLDEGLIGKLLSMWETPSKDEIDVWYTLERK